MSNQETSGLSADQQRVQFLTKQVGLEHEEALHAIGRRRGGWPKLRGLSRQEQSNKVQEYVGYGLTKIEAERIVGIFIEASVVSHRPRKKAANTASPDWMPAKKVYDSPWPARSRKGLLK